MREQTKYLLTQLLNVFVSIVCLAGLAVLSGVIIKMLYIAFMWGWRVIR